MEVKSRSLKQCPYCDDELIINEVPDMESRFIERKCQGCKRTWEEWFDVHTIYIPVDNEGAYVINNPTVQVYVTPRIFNPQPKPEKGKKR